MSSSHDYGRAGRGNRGNRNNRSRGAANHRGRGSYQSQPQYDNGDDEDMNSHLHERFGRGSTTDRGNGNYRMDQKLHSASLSGFDVKLNPKIREYIQKQNSIVSQHGTEDWLLAPEIPASGEIFLADGTSVVLPANKTEKPYKSAAKYLKTHYQLLREDAASPLRDAVDKFRRDPDMVDDKDVNIYDKVYISGFTFTMNGIAARIKLSTQRAGRRILWQASKRLTSGTIVALSPANDKFRTTCTIAIVAARPLELLARQPSEIDIYFSRPEDIEIDPQQEFLMVEAKQGYYEAYRHTLKALQKMSTEAFPLSGLVIGHSSQPEYPDHLLSSPIRSLAAAFEEQSSADFKNINVINDWPLSADKTTLDPTQWSALQQILTKRLAIIQGPPGTGKTHVSKIALQIMFENRLADDPPIIVAAQTNHALDQLLLHVSAFDNNYIRLGGRSTQLEVKKHALFEVRQRETIPQVPNSRLGIARTQLRTHQTVFGEILSLLDDSPEPISAETFFNLGIITAKQKQSLEDSVKNWVTADVSEMSAIQHWVHNGLIPFEIVPEDDNFGFEEVEEDLELEQLRETEAEHGVNDEEDIEQLQGPWRAVYDRWTVTQPSDGDLEKAKRYLDTRQDLWSIPEYLRGSVYFIMQRQAKDLARSRFRDAAKKYHELTEEVRIGRWEKDSVYLKRANIIGMTTTGLSKYRPLIASLEPKIILIEEAAEVIEGPVTAACVESLQQLILVGDHQQLQGHCSVSELEGPPYNLNISMFERLVKLKLPFKTLLKQRRMRPEFRELIRSLYSKLEDHEHVKIRSDPPPWGMGKINSFFMKHEWFENKDDSMSTYNEEEARLVVKFYRYLLQNGVPPEAVTMLTFYNGQRKRLLRELKQDSVTSGSYNKVKTVDSYQGEENEIVLLSLVRSNNENKIGFLENKNRVCVALSRAKFGFYIFGNAELLSTQTDLWSDVYTTLVKGRPQRVGNSLPLTCKTHGRVTHIRYPEQFDDLPNGGCGQPCGGVLDCDHPCSEPCHSYDHSLVKCQRLCNRELVCGHQCAKNCHESCYCPCDAYKETIDQVVLANHQSDTYNPQPVSHGYNGHDAWTSASTPSQLGELGVNVKNGSRGGRGNGVKPNKLARGGSAFYPQTERAQIDSVSSAVYDQPSAGSLDSTKTYPSMDGHARQKASGEWKSFADGGVKEDDKRRRELRHSPAKSQYRDQGIQADLLGLSPPNSPYQPVTNETEKGIGAGRSRYVQQYQAAPTSTEPAPGLDQRVKNMTLWD